MTKTLHGLGRSLEVTPARAAAFGAAVGGLFALIVLNLDGAQAVVDAIAPVGLFLVALPAIGAAVAWAAVGLNIRRG